MGYGPPEHNSEKTWVLTSNEINLMLDKIKAIATRDYLFIRMLWVTGCRVSELISVSKEDINFDSRRIKVKNLKHNGERLVFIDRLTRDELREYVSVNGDGYGKIFPFSRQHAFRITARWGSIFGYAKLSPHAFRRSLMTHLHKNGMDMYSIRLLLGHNTDFQSQEMYIRLPKTPDIDDMQSKYDSIFT